MWPMPASTASRMNPTCSSVCESRLVPNPTRGTSTSPSRKDVDICRHVMGRRESVRARRTLMAGELQGQRVAFVVANEGIEQVELTTPWEAVKKAGGTPELIAPKSGEAQAFNHLDKADTFPVDRTTKDVKVDEYDAVVLPGGVANPDQLRMDEPAVNFIKAMIDAGKPVAVICHGPWTLVEADKVRGRTLTSWPSLQTDIRNA